MSGNCCCLERYGNTRSTAAIQDALWWIEAEGTQKITEVTRLAIIEALEEYAISGRLELSEFMQRVTLRAPVKRPVSNVFEELFGSSGRKRPQISTKQFLQEWGLFEWPDKRFTLFIEFLVRPEVRHSKEQSDLVETLNAGLRHDGYVLTQSGFVSNQPVFKLQLLTRGVAGAAKNIIFASNGPKPEIGFKDAINNEIIILKHEASCLVFDEEIPQDGLFWDNLVDWWARKHGLDPSGEEARHSLGHRLQRSLDSEPEKLLFSTYFHEFRKKLGARLPALIPQVYLHYDPKTLAQLAGNRRLERQRMDFLLLLPGQVRVVIEVDGAQHYSDHNGSASPNKYAQMVRADRELRLLGYEVYRFGGLELRRDNRGVQVVKEFFEKLFAKYKLLKG